MAPLAGHLHQDGSIPQTIFQELAHRHDTSVLERSKHQQILDWPALHQHLVNAAAVTAGGPNRYTLHAICMNKESIVAALHGVPYVAGTEPVVFAWYPGARAGLLWNLEEQPRSFSVVRDGRVLAQVSVPALGVALIGDL